MPRQAKVERKAVLAAAAEIVRRDGEDAINARAIAKELGCSTQPVYSLFRNMEELRHALAEEAKARYRAHIDRYLAAGGPSRYQSYGMGFVKFARDEKGLFRFLFLGKRPVGDPFFEDIVQEMVTLYKMPEETARDLHADMSVFSFGLAVLVNGNSDALSEEDIADAFAREFFALYAFYFPERERFWEKEAGERV